MMFKRGVSDEEITVYGQSDHVCSEAVGKWGDYVPATLLNIWLEQSGNLFASPDWIIQLLGVLVLLSAISLLLGDRIQAMQTSNRIGQPERFLNIQSALTTVAEGLLGTLVTLTSVGAGALGAVLLRAVYPLRMQPRHLIATETIHAIPVSLPEGAKLPCARNDRYTRFDIAINWLCSGSNSGEPSCNNNQNNKLKNYTINFFLYCWNEYYIT